jgi:hypothetical protein
MWAALSVGSIIGGVAYGWRRPPGSDARHVVLFTALYGIPLMAVPLAASVPELMLAMFAAGLFSAPFIIAMFGIRQRSVEPYLHGRVFAITVSINAAGVPPGAFWRPARGPGRRPSPALRRRAGSAAGGRAGGGAPGSSPVMPGRRGGGDRLTPRLAPGHMPTRRQLASRPTGSARDRAARTPGVLSHPPRGVFGSSGWRFG